ncbi:hypothetical protein HYH03_004637 [Edaphochlamys debaryana]|uniref:Uncharacterized protein n=1 Tax=Edaphochlamys debaryana TaxID=47281 RepID=A0A836C3A8_9CHLO|nr:hypothetical protein HYH03_004637 [Edaphochlamys debaryana]|eukprot:KAG2497484.1 hypothetical protein HYH03_004637 [Edaphochlamys debaryana]
MSSHRSSGASSSSRTAAAGSSPGAVARNPSGARTPTKEPSRASTTHSTTSPGPAPARAHAHRSAAAIAASLAASASGGGDESEIVVQLRERLAQLEADLQSSQETNQWTIKQNKNTLLALKQENKELAGEVSRRGGSTELQGKAGTASDGERLVQRLERQVHELRRGYDKVIKDKKTAIQRLDNLHDSLRDLAKVAGGALPGAAEGKGGSAIAASLSGPAGPLAGLGGAALGLSVCSEGSVGSSAGGLSQGAIAGAIAALPPNSAAGRELRGLQNRLDKASFKANEAFSIRKTYEQVIEKLRAEEPLLEARIRALEEQRAMKQAAIVTAQLVGREASAAKEATKGELAALEAEVAAGRARRAKALAGAREKAATLQQTNRALMQRQFQPLATGDTPPGGNSAAATPRGGTAACASAGASAGGAEGAASRAAASAAAAGEAGDITARDLVVRLCRSTGARRVAELLARLLAQQESYKGLLAMQSQAAAQRLQAAAEVEVLRGHREELRGGGKMSTQKQLDAAQAELRSAEAAADATQASLEQLLRAYADVRGGVEHLSGLAAPLPLPAGAPPAVPLEDETVGDVLAQVEQRLLNAYRLMTSLPKALDMLEAMYASLRDDAP